MPVVPLINGFAHLAGRYELLLCDIWGVIHNGRESFPGVVDCLRKARAGATVLLLSNAPRPNEPIRAQLASLGVPADAYDALVTSGDLTRALLTERSGAKRYPVHHVGPDRDLPLFEGLTAVARVGVDEAEAIVCTGPFDDTKEGPADYRDYWTAPLARKLPFLCANPDLVVQRGDQMIYCAGALAHDYENRGGEVVYLGKPHAPAYDYVAAHIRELTGRDIPRARWLAIGDGLKTDIAGANAAGIDALLVTGGIHEAEFAGPNRAPDPDRIGAVLNERTLHAVAALPRLVW